MAAIAPLPAPRESDRLVGEPQPPPPCPAPSRVTRLRSAMTTRAVTEHVVHLIATTRTIQLIWWLVVVVQLLNGCYLLFFSSIYLSYERNADSLLAYLATCFLSTPQRAFLQTFSVWVGAVFAVLGACFMWSTMTMVVGTAWNRHASVGFSAMRPVAPKIGPRMVATAATLFAALGLSKLRQTIARAWVAWGVRGNHFDQAVLVRETIELFYQAIQADQISRRISNRTVNHAYTALIAANTLMHPLISRVFARNPSMKRFAVVFTDLFSDFVWGCVLPTWMLWPYMQLDRSVPREILLISSGFGSVENAQREVEQLVILTWSALLLSVLPFSSALLSLRSVKKLLSGAEQFQSWGEVTEEEHFASPGVRHTVNTKSIGHVNRKPTRSRTHRLVPVRTSRLVSCGHILLSFGGVLVALIGVASSGILIAKSDNPFRVWDHACKYPLTPWFSTKPACAVWFLNCTEMAIRGNAAEMQAAFSLVHADSLVFLRLMSCPHLEVDRPLLQFKNLRAVMLTESQEVSWASEAALTSQHFPVLQVVVFENLQLSTDVEKIRDITALCMSDNATMWVNLLGWHCVRCGLREFPTMLFQSTHLREFVLEGTAVDFIPPARGHYVGPTLWPNLVRLNLQSSPSLESLSDDVWGLFAHGSLRKLQLGGSNVSTIPPQWIASLPQAPAIYAANSPLCHNRTAYGSLPALDCRPSD